MPEKLKINLPVNSIEKIPTEKTDLNKETKNNDIKSLYE